MGCFSLKCVVITQDESEVGKYMLLVSKDLFHLNICKFNVKHQALVKSISLMLQRSNELIVQSLILLGSQVSGFKILLMYA